MSYPSKNTPEASAKSADNVALVISSVAFDVLSALLTLKHRSEAVSLEKLSKMTNAGNKTNIRKIMERFLTEGWVEHTKGGICDWSCRLVFVEMPAEN